MVKLSQSDTPNREACTSDTPPSYRAENGKQKKIIIDLIKGSLCFVRFPPLGVGGGGLGYAKGNGSQPPTSGTDT